MKIVTTEQMRAIDAATFAAVPSIVVMENAGRCVTEALVSAFPIAHNIRVVAGKGNNGGDGFCVARTLKSLGRKVEVVLTVDPKELKGDALTNYHAWSKTGGLTHPCDFDFKKRFEGCEVVVDAIYGTGFRGEISGVEKEVINFVNSLRNVGEIYTVSIDIPSGVSGDSGEVGGCAFIADLTVTLEHLKWGLILEPGATYAGDIHVANIGLLPKSASDADASLLGWENIAPLLNQRSGRNADTHKGERGHVLVVGGAEGHFGASFLSADGAFKSGAGLVTLFIPEETANSIVATRPEFMTLLRKETEDGTPDPARKQVCVDFITQRLTTRSAIVLGPGLEGGEHYVEMVLSSSGRTPLVIDAAAIRTIASNQNLRKAVGPNVVMTPHPGELGALLGKTASEVQASRLASVRDAAKALNCVVILKGSRTIIAAPSGRIAVNPSTARTLATAGSGDVLAGVIATFLAQGLSPWEAACAAVFVHGVAGEFLQATEESEGRTARDILDEIPRVITSVQEFAPELNTRFISHAIAPLDSSG